MFPAMKMTGLRAKPGKKVRDMVNYTIYGNSDAWLNTNSKQTRRSTQYNYIEIPYQTTAATNITYATGIWATFGPQEYATADTQCNVTVSGSGVCWADAYQMAYQPSTHWIYYNGPRMKETAEEKAARDKRNHDHQVAASRADLLLLSFLSDAQTEQYQREQRFELHINGRHYRIHKGRSGNIQLIENGKPVAKYCAHPELWTPDGDTLVAQMLMLQTDEAAFLKIANRTSLV